MFKTIFHEKNNAVIPHFINDGTWSLKYDISIKLTTYHSFGRIIQITSNCYGVEDVVIENIHSYSDELLYELNEYINDIKRILSTTFIDKSIPGCINTPLYDTILNHVSYTVNDELQSRQITKHNTRKMRKDDYFKNTYVLSIITKKLIKHIGLSFLTRPNFDEANSYYNIRCLRF